VNGFLFWGKLGGKFGIAKEKRKIVRRRITPSVFWDI
jgi:hypothetical protein